MTTIIGNSGTGARDGRDLRIVSAQPEGMATAILEVLADDGEWLRLAENGRKFIQTHYDWSQTTANMVQFLQSVSQQRT